MVEVPVLAMAVAGLWLLVRHGKQFLTLGVFRVFTIVFLLAWVPILISLIDAVNPERTLVVAVNHLRFFFAGIFMLHALGDRLAQNRFLTLSAWLLGFWVVDALVQSAIGVDLVGRAPSTTGLSGIFGFDGKHFATFLAIFSPLLFEHARRCWPVWVQVLTFVATTFVIISAGSRAAWVAFLCVIAAYAILFWARRRKFPWKPVSLCLVLGVAIGTLGYQVSRPFQLRVDQTFTEMKRPFQIGSLSHRAWIWRGGWNMFRAHPVNGVGARGFRYAYAEYADANDPYLAGVPPILPTHSHQMLLEVATETGLIGLAGLFALIGVLVHAGWRASARAQRYMLPFALALTAVYFPLNTHWAIYGAHLSQVLWFMIALYFAARAAGSAAEPRPAGHTNGTSAFT